MPIQEFKDDPRTGLDLGRGVIASTSSFSEVELAQLQESLKKGYAVWEKTLTAPWMVQINFGHRHKTHSASTDGVVTLWHQRAHFDGGADQMAFICPGKERRNNGCSAVLPQEAHGVDVTMCPACGSLWRPEELHSQVFYRLPLQSWADVVLTWFQRCDMKADLYAIVAYDDIRDANMKELERSRGGEVLRKVRMNRKKARRKYRLQNIIQDINAGASLRGRILEFLKA